MLYNSPLGIIKIKISDIYINELTFLNEEEEQIQNETIELSTGDKKILQKCIKQLDEYFSGDRKIFDLPIQQKGTPFQQNVWNKLIQIPLVKQLVTCSLHNSWEM